MTLHEILWVSSSAFAGYLLRALGAWAWRGSAGAIRLGPRVVSGVPLPCPSDPRWREATKKRLTRTCAFGDPHAREEVREVAVLVLGRLCVDEGSVELFVLRGDGSAGEPLPGAKAYAGQVIRQRQARAALESIALAEAPPSRPPLEG